MGTRSTNLNDDHRFRKSGMKEPVRRGKAGVKKTKKKSGRYHGEETKAKAKILKKSRWLVIQKQ